MSKSWTKITITLSKGIEEAVSNYLFELGASGVVNLEQGLEAFFEKTNPETELRGSVLNYINQLSELGFDTANCTIELQHVANKDWNAEWKKNFKITPVTENIVIKPSWEPMPDKTPKCLIEIDPGMAFGTGTHETTILMLRLLEKNLGAKNTVLDIGTGTGILSIAALKLGAVQATAFDIDPLATEATLENAAKNNVAEKLNVFTGQLSDLGPGTFDLLLANVNKTEILKILPSITSFMHENSRLLLSGLLAIEEKVVIKRLAQQNLLVREILPLGEWVAIHAEIATANE